MMHPPFVEESRQSLRRVHNLDDVAADVPADLFGRLLLDQKASPVHDDQPIAAVGDVVPVRRTVRIDRDFGTGYTNRRLSGMGNFRSSP